MMKNVKLILMVLVLSTLLLTSPTLAIFRMPATEFVGAVNMTYPTTFMPSGEPAAPASNAIVFYAANGIPYYRNATGSYGISGGAVTGGSGDVVGPASSITHNFATYADGAGKTLEDSGKGAAYFSTKAYADGKINKSGDTMSGQLHGMTAGTSSLDVANMAQLWAKVNKSGDTMTGQLEVINGTTGQQAVSYSQLASVMTNSNFMFATAWGVKADGTTDDWQSIQNCINATPHRAFYEAGSTIILPPGLIRFSRGFVVDDAGTKIKGAGNPATTLQPLSNFSGSQVFLYNVTATNAYSAVGVGLSDMQVFANNVNANFVEVRKAYDSTTFENIDVYNVKSDKSAFRFIPNPANTADPYSQGIIMQNVIAQHSGVNGTANLYYFNTCNEIQLIGVKGFGGPSPAGSDPDVAASATPFNFVDCSAVTMIGCSAAFSHLSGIKISTSARESNGIFIYGMTYETIQGQIDADGTSSYSVTGINQQATRNLGIVRTGANLEYVTYSKIDVADKPTTLQSHATYNQITSRDFTVMTDSGTYNTFLDFTAQLSVAKTNTPTLNWKVPGRTDWWNLAWSATTGVDYKFVLGKFNGIATNTVAEFDDAPASGNVGLFLRRNVGGAYSLQQVSMGAAESGGAGYRLLRVPN